MEKLKKLMKERGKTVAAIASSLNVHETAVFCWLRGEYLPSKTNAKKLIQLFGGELTFDDIYG